VDAGACRQRIPCIDCAGADPALRRRAGVPGSFRAAFLRRPSRRDLRPDPSDRAVLQHAAARRSERQERHQAGALARRELDGLEGRQDLHLQAAPRRQVPRRLGDDLEGHQGVVRPHHLPAAGRRLEPQGAVRGRRVGRGGRPVHGGVPPQAPLGLVHLVAALALQLHLQGRHPREGSALVRDPHHGHRAVRLRRARQGLARGRQEEPQLLGQGQAVSRQLPRDLHSQLLGAGRGSSAASRRPSATR